LISTHIKLSSKLIVKYKDYIGKDVYVFQYKKNKFKNIELEDIIPQELIIDSYIKTAKMHNLEVEDKEINSLILKSKPYCEYNKDIMENFNLDDSFKKNFKEILNQEIENKLTSLKDENSFEKTFSDYHIWVSNLVMEIQKTDTITDTK